jgi:hypothetical protein
LNYKELIFKLTSKNNKNKEVIDKTNDYDLKDFKSIKLKKQKKDSEKDFFSIGIIINEEFQMPNTLVGTLKNMIDRILTIYSQVPILNNYRFISMDKNTLDFCIKSFPNVQNVFIFDNNQKNISLDNLKKIKYNFLNFDNIIISKNPKKDFADSIDILITLNNPKMDDDLQEYLINKNISIHDLMFQNDIENKSQKEKLVTVDSNGWNYNSATGKWVKSLPDGVTEIEGW